jgi:hypothetical protein
MRVYVLFVHKKICFKEKRLYYFQKKFLKTPKKNKKNIFSGFFIANPDQVEVRDLTAGAQLSHVLHTVDLVVEMQYSPVGEL